MSFAAAWMMSDIGQNAADIGSVVTLRKRTSLGGPDPAINPVTGTVTVAAAALVGAASVTLNAPPGNWFLAAGDQFSIAGTTTVYTVTAQSIAASGVFSGVAVTPVLASAAAAGALVSFIFAGDYSVAAVVSRYRDEMINGTLVTASDINVVMPVMDLFGRAIPVPSTEDRVIVGGISRAVLTVGTTRVAGAALAYDVQLR
ncbi:MAG: hypothetical protein HQL37_01655 [Alphaproteobacteria bacterium]|nr:hypothetical protein [Alphaproteobacteria bacterium]